MTFRNFFRGMLGLDRPPEPQAEQPVAVPGTADLGIKAAKESVATTAATKDEGDDTAGPERSFLRPDVLTEQQAALRAEREAAREQDRLDAASVAGQHRRAQEDTLARSREQLQSTIDEQTRQMASDVQPKPFSYRDHYRKLAEQNQRPSIGSPGEKWRERDAGPSR